MAAIVYNCLTFSCNQWNPEQWPENQAAHHAGTDSHGAHYLSCPGDAFSMTIRANNVLRPSTKLWHGIEHSSFSIHAISLHANYWSRLFTTTMKQTMIVAAAIGLLPVSVQEVL